MNVFKINKKPNTVRTPVLKIVFSLSIILVCITRSYVIQFSNEIVNIAVTLACVLLTIMGVLVVYISLAEIIYVVDYHWLLNIKAQGVSKDKTKNYTTDEIIEMIEKNDIIDILIKSNGRVVSIGSCSDCKISDNTFFDKQYYIDETTYSNIDEFRTALASTNNNDETISVISIDGISAKKL